ncbi:30S ribosomal protein S9 [Candidatus Falkowbacteria bacterium RIFOXYC2_FULL_47_12]|uniref:Small ribosomal subunit protein uS9 n=2 Tax=Candidatus Falkowiibacteriota TaxID=1752728 RepID=A0A1F5TR65_9BACT|nr:MAG: 30S ribosomal protein S9 [Candidatus Falkowbacteria bacterium RIFOXYA2_FULL_47_9]OGF41403.1 MAG: 30S ribosomal protein S9 [Candidatus Falkowbacteria bacterium RIFOXYC2_FULL_47_12]
MAETQKSHEFKGSYIAAIGRRKRAAAQVRLYADGSGVITVNGRPFAVYFPTELLQRTVRMPLVAAGVDGTVDISIVVKGGGKVGQAEAVRHGIARALLAENKDIKPVLKAEKLLTRDSRRKERKKPGLKKARKAPQWSKR